MQNPGDFMVKVLDRLFFRIHSSIIIVGTLFPHIPEKKRCGDNSNLQQYWLLAKPSESGWGAKKIPTAEEESHFFDLSLWTSVTTRRNFSETFPGEKTLL